MKLKRDVFYSKMEEGQKRNNVKSKKSILSINNIVVFIRFNDESKFTDPIAVYDSMFNSSNLTANFNEELF